MAEEVGNSGGPTSLPGAHRLVFPDLDVFRRASLLLGERGLVLRSVDPSAGAAGLAGFITGLQHAGQIWVQGRHLDHALRLLDEYDLPSALPLVDRSDPACPGCAAALAPDAPACAACGLRVQWVEIEETATDPEGRTCDCGYDLTGNRHGRCPECGVEIPFDAAAAAVDGIPGVSATPPDLDAPSVAPPSVPARRLRAGVAGLILIAGGMAMQADDRLRALGALLLMAGAACLFVVLLIR